MEGHELLGKLNRVEAPPGFDERVLAKLGEARRALAHRRTVWRYSFAGAAGIVLVGVVALSVFAPQHRAAATLAAKRAPAVSVEAVAPSQPVRQRASQATIPVLEAVDYSEEVHSVSPQPQTVYILEQVSESRPSEIKY
jgi:hypothetical protein